MAVANSDDLETRVENFHDNLQDFDLEKFSDIYFKWSKAALEKDGFNPIVTKHVHAGLTEEMSVAGLEETAEIYDEMTSEEVDIYLGDDSVDGREPLMMVEGPLQEVLVPETLVLGSLSYHLTEENTEDGFSHVTSEEYEDGIRLVADILGDLNQELDLDEEKVGFADFGARHYHPVQQLELAKAAQKAYESIEVFEDDVVGHSTLKGVEAINEMLEEQGDDKRAEASGTMNHAFVIPYGWKHGMENATIEAFKAYDDWVQESLDIPTPVLIDTNNQEISDTIQVCEYLEEQRGEDFELTVRIDTNSANYAEGVETGEESDKGVSVEAVEEWNEALIEEGYRDNINFLISSGKGKTEELKEFKDAFIDFYEEKGYKLFDGVGAGSFDTTNNIYATSDIVEVEGEKVGKKGRLGELLDTVDQDYSAHIDQNMTQYKEAV